LSNDKINSHDLEGHSSKQMNSAKMTKVIAKTDEDASSYE